MIIDSETFSEIESAITQAAQGVSAATQLVKGLGPQTEVCAYIYRLLNRFRGAGPRPACWAWFDVLKEANQESSISKKSIWRCSIISKGLLP